MAECYKCKKPIYDGEPYTMFNVAPGAASGGTLLPHHQECVPQYFLASSLRSEASPQDAVTISLIDPHVIIAGIRQFGLAPDGSDLRDLESAFARLSATAPGETHVVIKTKIRPNAGVPVDNDGRCENTDEVVGTGYLHVEQMSGYCFWARLYTKDGRDVVMWFNSSAPISLTAEFD